MDAKEHLYKVLVIGEYGVGGSFNDPLYFEYISCWSLFSLSFFTREGKRGWWSFSSWGLPCAVVFAHFRYCSWILLFIFWLPNHNSFVSLMVYHQRRPLSGDTLKVCENEAICNLPGCLSRESVDHGVSFPNSWFPSTQYQVTWMRYQ